MRRRREVIVVTCMAVAALFSGWSEAIAAPLPKEAAKPISPENASEVKSVKEVARSVYRITRAAKQGELILFDFKDAGELVDDKLFNSIRLLAKDRKLWDLTMSADGKLVAWNEANQKTYTIQELESGKSFDIEIGEHPGRAAFSPDGKLIAIGYTFWDPNAHGVGHSEMRLYDLKGKLVRTLDKNGPGALQPLFSPDGKTLAVGNRNHETQLFDVATGKLLHKLDKRMTQEVAFSPDGKKLAAGYVDGLVALWDVATGQLLRSEASGCKEIYSVDFSPKGDLFASSGRDGKIILWEPGTFKRLKELDAPFWVIQVRFTADGTRLLSSSAADYGAKIDRKIQVWAVP